MSGQMPDAVANFVVPAEIKTLPEHPSFCRSDIGVMVTVDGDFADGDIIWDHVKTGTILKGKSQTLKHAGIWKITVKYNLNGATCEKTKAINVSDLNDPFQIQTYFSQAGFWPVKIFRNLEEAQCRGCGCEDDLDKVSFQDSPSLNISLLDDFENFQAFRPFQGMEYTKKISNNACLCNDDGSSNISDFEATLADGDLSLWGHQFFENEDTREGKLYVKASMSWQQSSPVGAHKNRLNKIVDDIISQNPGTTNQARVLFTNLFMTNPIGGYDLKNECKDPTGCYAQGNYLTPAGIPIKLPDGGIDYIFAPNSLPDNVFEGALLGFTDNTSKIMRSFRFQGTKFAGYFHELSATIAEGFESVPINSYPTQMDAFLPIICEGECKILSIEYSVLNNLTDSYGGLNLELKQDVAGDQLFGGCIDLGRRNRGSRSGIDYATFMTPTAGLISLDIKKINKLRFVYQEYESTNVEELSAGMLWKFELKQDPETGCGIKKYIYNPATFSYVNEDQEVYVDESNEDDIFNFNYVMNCNGNYALRNLEKGDRQKHTNSGPNYHESFTSLTSDINFIPFSESFPGTFGDGTFSIGSKINCSYCPSVETSTQIVQSKYCTQPEHIFVEKIAQLATVYDAYFVDPGNGNTSCGYAFTQKKNWEDPQPIYLENPTGNSGVTVPGNLWPWNVYLTNNPSIKQQLTSDKINFFKNFIEKLKETKQQQISWWNANVAQRTVDEIVCHLRKEPQTVTTSIPWEDKKRTALDIVNTGLIYQDKEDAIIHLLASSSATKVLPYIQEKKVSYYFNVFDDAGGDDNLTRIMTLIAAKIKEKGENYVLGLQNFHNNPSSIPKLEADLWSWGNLVHFINDNDVYINNIQYRYDQILPINITGSFTVDGTTYTKGLQVNMPAIQAALLAHDNGKKVSARVGWIAIDLGTLALGVGGAKILLTSGNYLRKAAIVGDLVGSTAGLAVNVLDNDAITPELRSQVQIVAFALSLPQIGISIFDAVTTARNLRTLHPNDYDAVQEGLALRREAARRDLEGFDDAWDFVRTNTRGGEVWESLILENFDVNLRRNADALHHIANAIENGLDPYDAITDAIQMINKTDWYDIEPLVTRGNNFNLKARTQKWYPFDEIHLANGKRLDSYDRINGEIISRKATNFDNIQTSTFTNYLSEFNEKYSQGTIIRSDKYPVLDGEPLSGQYILEVPDVNLNSVKRVEYETLAANNNILIRYKAE